MESVWYIFKNKSFIFILEAIMYKLKDELKKFGARLRELRKERKMTQEQLAEKIGMF